jgi:hypothetical protein
MQINTSKYLLTYLITSSMEQSRSWEANWFAASREIPRVLWNPNVPHRTHMRPPPVPSWASPIQSSHQYPTFKVFASYTIYDS